MSKRELSLTADINKTNAKLCLNKINKVSPLSFSVFCYNTNTTLSFCITNGGKDGRGVCSYTDVRSVKVFNGKNTGRRLQASPVIPTQPHTNRVGFLLAVKRVLDINFANKPIDYTFNIKLPELNKDDKNAISYNCVFVDSVGTSFYRLVAVSPFGKLDIETELKKYNFGKGNVVTTDNNEILIKQSKTTNRLLRSCITQDLIRKARVMGLPSFNKNNELIHEESVINVVVNTADSRPMALYKSTNGVCNCNAYENGPYNPVQDTGQEGYYFTNRRLIITKQSGAHIRNHLRLQKANYMYRYSGERLEMENRAPDLGKRLLLVFAYADQLVKYNKAKKCNHSIALTLDGITFTMEQLLDMYNTPKASMDITYKIPVDESITWFKFICNMRLNKRVRNHLRKIKEIRKGNYVLTFTDKKNSISREELNLNISGSYIKAELNFMQRAGAALVYNKVINIFKKFYADNIQYVILNTKIEKSYELYPTTRCTELDYVIKVGAEFETGLSGVEAKRADSYEDEAGAVYSSCFDGGGVELRTAVLANPTMFSWIGRFDALCKNMRNHRRWSPYVGSSTHMHITINPAPKVNVPTGKKTQEVNPTWYGNAIFRRRLIGINWWSSFIEFNLGLAFFDTFTRGGRRNTHYGMRFQYKNKNLNNNVFRDSRFTGLWGRSVKDIIRSHSTGRDSLLRVCNMDSSVLHFEWRGTDVCASAIFTGLKAELLVAMARYAIHNALKGNELPLFPERSKRELEYINKLPSGLDVTDKYCRKFAKKMITKLRPWLSPEAYRGLNAWVLFVDILNKDVGTKGWYEKMEAIIIKRVGASNFITNEDLKKEFKYDAKKMVFKADSSSGRGSKYNVVIPYGTPDDNVFGRSYYGSNGHRSQDPGAYCSSCGIRTTYKVVEGFKFCKECSIKHTRNNKILKKGANKFSDKKNTTPKYNKLVKELATTVIKVQEG